MNGIQEVMGSIPTVSTKQKALVIRPVLFAVYVVLSNDLRRLHPRTELLIINVKFNMDFVALENLYPLN